MPTREAAMNELTERLMRLSTAEQFLEFFAIPFDQAVVNVCRLHILKRFYQYLHREAGLDALDDGAIFARYRALLATAYEDFVRSTPAQEKVFKVFQDAEGRSVSLAAVRANLPSAGER
jgi:nitrogenase-stabilizing/protective protein